MYRCLIVYFCLTAIAATQTQTKGLWADWEPFLGTWQGVGSGEPGQGKGEFTFEPSLQGAILTRHNYAEYPASKDKAAYRHDDLMVIYPDADNKKTRADYWDNEGHMIHYDVELSATRLVFISNEAEAGPRYRLTYLKSADGDELKLTFEIAPPTNRKSFKTYIEASARRKARN